ncbi:MAG: lysophospholipase [Candidatus Omnitrophica bacterium]|nr:lysophospholipase [Candidatus Omnitrophota bacterium]MBU4477628.1 lysophospholipase [Candidatus Omnitrophota bacterium]MCG2704304.1 lysophospholipase [Candidatus Omnitrophota bacterium]
MTKKISGTLRTKDNVTLAYEHRKRGFPEVVVVCPGFFNSKKNRWMRETVEILNESYDTVIFDFRGHGESSGRFTWSAKEHYDVESVLDYAHSCGYKAVGILGYSLGAAASINAVSRTQNVKSMILISGPFSFWQINYHFWEPAMLSDLKDNIECDWEGKGARVDNVFIPKPKPVTQIKYIKHTPIFFIHGTRDWIIKDYHSQKLYEAAPGRKRIEIISEGLHAERMVQQDTARMRKLFLDWFAATLDGGGDKNMTEGRGTTARYAR